MMTCNECSPPARPRRRPTLVGCPRSSPARGFLRVSLAVRPVPVVVIGPRPGLLPARVLRVPCLGSVGRSLSAQQAFLRRHIA